MSSSGVSGVSGVECVEFVQEHRRPRLLLEMVVGERDSSLHVSTTTSHLTCHHQNTHLHYSLHSKSLINVLIQHLVHRGRMNGSNGTHEAHPFVLKQDEVFGQYLEATRDIPAGSVVLEEDYAFWGPSADYVEDYATPICCGCAVVMNDGNEDSRCPKCHWPLCSPTCDKVDYHEAFECSLFSREGVGFPPQQLPIQHAYKGLTIIRGLLLKPKNPDLWGQVMNLQWVNEIQDSPPPDMSQFRTEFGLPDFSTPEEWTRILGTLNVNSYSIQRIEQKAGSPSFAEFIYPFQCLMNHSCVPNCNWAIAYSPSFTIRATAAVDIKQGSMLTVAYNYDLSKYGTHKRHQKIRDQAKFSCKCPRCQDPTDFGTFSAAVTCFKCISGFLLPLNSLDLLYGRGGTFCSGYDLSEAATGLSENFGDNEYYNPFNQKGIGPMGPSRRFFKKPVIAAISGYAVAGGMELALMCDVRVIEDTAVMGVFCRRFGTPNLNQPEVDLSPHEREGERRE